VYEITSKAADQNPPLLAFITGIAQVAWPIYDELDGKEGKRTIASLDYESLVVILSVYSTKAGSTGRVLAEGLGEWKRRGP
jgi:hypothetical protein